MLAVRLNRENYEYDIQALLRSFYPEQPLRIITPASREQEIREGEQEWSIRIEEPAAHMLLDGREITWRNEEEQGAFKDGFKRFFYRTLAELTGRELPWGNLTGIRPTKIAYAMLEEGKEDGEIIDWLRQNHYVSREKSELSIDIARRERRLLSKIHYQGGYSLYIGIPFCPSTCLYCSFTSYPIAAYRERVERYIDCVIRELAYVSQAWGNKVLDTVYIGGGTPTTLEPEQLERLLGSLRELFDFSTVQEFTVEAGRADSITGDKLEVLRRYGVSRISVNPQTMKQDTLDIIGRKATVEQVVEAYKLAREAGFDNINMDLILGLPGEDEADVRRTIDRVVDLSPDSLTVHSLAIKRASRLNQWIQEHGIGTLRNTDETMKIAAAGAAVLNMHPYYLYRQKNMSGNFENVGYARDGKYGLYNILIMEEVQTIVALGAGAITKRVYPDGRIERCENVKEVAQYIERIDEMIERKERLLSD
ncbi:MAG: coproporphyrinogen dehydrogenase HemZ [Acetatifactor sp.]